MAVKRYTKVKTSLNYKLIVKNQKLAEESELLNKLSCDFLQAILILKVIQQCK